MPLVKDQKTEIVAQNQVHDGDTGSSDVQIALLTGRINQLIGHLKTHERDHSSRRGLLMMVGERRRHLAYLARNDAGRYRAVIARLGLRK